MLVTMIVAFVAIIGEIVTIVLISTSNPALESSSKSTKEEQNVNQDQDKLKNEYLGMVRQHFKKIGLLNYLEGEKVKVADWSAVDTSTDQSQSQFEYTLFLEGKLSNDFETLTENEKFKLLDSVDFGSWEYLNGNGFNVKTLSLKSGTNVYSITDHTLEKNGEKYWSQLENPFEGLEVQSLNNGSGYTPTNFDFDVYLYMKEEYQKLTNNWTDYQPELHDPQVAEMAADKYEISTEKARQIYADIEKWNNQ